ncbi:MAG: serine--tRNA ligase, partial [Candidatus Paceibacterota bacterium]
MLDINLIRQEPDKVKEGIKNKGAKPSIVDDFLEVDERWRTLSQEIDNLRAERNKVTEEISSTSSSSLRAERSNLIQKAKEIKG